MKERIDDIVPCMSTPLLMWRSVIKHSFGQVGVVDSGSDAVLLA